MFKALQQHGHVGATHHFVTALQQHGHVGATHHYVTALQQHGHVGATHHYVTAIQQHGHVDATHHFVKYSSIGAKVGNLWQNNFSATRQSYLFQSTINIKLVRATVTNQCFGSSSDASGESE